MKKITAQEKADIRLAEKLSTQEINGILTDYEKRNLHSQLGRYLLNPEQRCLMTLSQLTVFQPRTIRVNDDWITVGVMRQTPENSASASKGAKGEDKDGKKGKTAGGPDGINEKLLQIRSYTALGLNGSMINLGDFMQWETSAFKKALVQSDARRPYLETEEACDILVSRKMRQKTNQRLRILKEQEFEEHEWPKPAPLEKKPLQVLQSFYAWRKRAREIIHMRAILFNRILQEKLLSQGIRTNPRKPFLPLQPYKDSIGEFFWFNGSENDRIHPHFLNHPNYCFFTEFLAS